MLKVRDDKDHVSAVLDTGTSAAEQTSFVTKIPRKILFYVPSLGDGGGERLWAGLATAFHQAGHSVLFAQDFEADDSRHVLDDAIPIFTLGSKHTTTIRRLAHLLKEHQPDVALSAIAGSNLKLVTARLLSGTTTKIIQTFHGHNEWKTGKLSYVTARALPLTSRLCARTVAVSEPLRDDLVNTWLAKSDNTIFIANPVLLPPRVAQPTKAQLNARQPIILAVGRLTPDKDYSTLIKAFARLAETDARLIILGKGPEQEKIASLIDALGLKSKVKIEGFVPEPWSYFERAKCLALASKSESFGNVIVEALAHGLPIVATHTDGPKHILTSPDLGRCVPVGDVSSMAAALAETLKDPGDPKPRFARASDFAMETRFPAYEAMVEEVLSDSCTKPVGARTEREI